MPQTDLAFRPVHELSADIARRRLSPVDLVEAFLTCIETREPKLHALTTHQKFLHPGSLM